LGERAYLSIGEVLSLLREEFPDVTISKIRFLESQGLLDPERTPSGYRKFYEGDVERLRWILQQQRENFLPLKVIKGRLAEPAAAPAPASGAVPAAPAAVVPQPALAGDPPPADMLSAGTTAVNMTGDELCAAVGISDHELRELEGYGLVAGRHVAGSTYYDEEALVVAKLAAGFLRYGVEARHLRMYKTSAEREAGFFEQVVMPLVKQRNPTARRQALDTLNEMAKLGAGLRAAMLRQALKDYTST
jgi:DNA-binding transcriptional MerR regulator